MFGRKGTRIVGVLTVVASVVLLPTTAFARFGKASSQGSSGSSGGGGGAHSSGSYHAATPVHPLDRPYVGPGNTRAYYTPDYRWRSHYSWWYGYYPYYPFYGPPYDYYPYYYVGEPPSGMYIGRSAVATTIGLDGQVTSSGSANSFGVSLAFEGQRFGFKGEYRGLFLPAENGPGKDNIGLLNGFLTYALLASPHGRLRIEGGFNSAFAPDKDFAGPAVGLSAVVAIAGPLAIEGSSHITPFPYTQFDWQAGLGLSFGPVGLRAGWRRIFLNDQGLVDGISHKDVFSGPYAGLGVRF